MVFVKMRSVLPVVLLTFFSGGILYKLSVHSPLEETTTYMSLPNPVLIDHDKPNSIANCTPSAPYLPGPFFHPARDTDTAEVHTLAQKHAPTCRPQTPLFIPFASNACLLQQTVLSYIAEGWPASQIIVLDNTGASRENSHGLNDPHHHTFLNYTLLRHMYGVNVRQSPVRLTFAQLQNLLLELARAAKWDDFYVSHQDVVVRSTLDAGASRPLYHNLLHEYFATKREFSENPSQWAFCFFHYDWLSHVNVLAADRIGPWDVLIPWYPSDCDYYGRARLAGLSIFDYYVGEFHDVAQCISDPERLLFLAEGGQEYRDVEKLLRDLANAKSRNKKGRNTWQGQQHGGISDDFGPRFFEVLNAGRKSYRMKWGTTQCDVASQQPGLYSWVKTRVAKMLSWL